MPVDYSLLNFKQPIGGVVATLPTVQAPANNGLNSLAGGLVQGMMQGQQLREGRQMMEYRQQQMDQSAQMFPSQLQQSQQAAASGQIDLENKQQARRDTAEARAAFNQSWDAGMEVMKRNDPAGYLNLQQSIANHEKTLADTADKMADTKIKSNAAYNSMAATGADLAQSAAAAEQTQPGMGQKVYQQGLTMMGPSLAASFPSEYNEQTHLILTKTGMDAQFKMAEEAANKNASSAQKDDKREIALIQKQEDGSITKGEQQELDRIQQRQNARGRGQAGNPYDAANAAAAQDRLKALQKENADLPRTLETIKRAEEALAKTPGALLNPVAGWFNAAMLDKNGQVLASNLNNLVLNYKNIQNMGSQGFTDRDREFVQAVQGGLNNYKGSLKEMLAQARTVAEHQQIANWLEESQIQKKTSSYGEWLADNPEPQAKVRDKEGKLFSLPASQLKQALSQGYTQE